MINVSTVASRMARPPKPEYLGYDKMSPLRLTKDEWMHLRAAASTLGVNISEILREGANLYIHERGKDGSQHRKETNQ